MKKKWCAFSIAEMLVVMLIMCIVLAAAAPIITKKASVPASSGSVNLPVGTIVAFNGDTKKIPSDWHICDGTKGTPNLVDTFLESTGSNSVGTPVNPGLPDIWGVFESGDDLVPKGAFKSIGCPGTESGSGPEHTTEFRASYWNPIYGSSTTVQPKAYVVYYIMKIK